MAAPGPTSDPSMPLEGLRVLDLTMAWAGPLATRVLAALGADVIKIEGASHMDRWRGGTSPQRGTDRYPQHDPGEEPWNRNAFFNTQNRNKRSLVLDLKSSRGREVFRELVAVSDVVVENFSAGALSRMGFDYPQLCRLQPEIVLVSLPAFGRTGPESEYVAHGPTIEAAAGHVSLQGYEGEGPLPSGLLAWGDPVAGMNGAFAAIAAINGLRSTGHGGHVDLSHVESAIPFNHEAFVDYAAFGLEAQRRGNRHESSVPHGVYRCAGDDQWLALACADDVQWRALCGLIGVSGVLDPEHDRAARERAVEEIDEAIGAWSVGRDRDASVEELQAAGVPAAAVATAADLLDDPQLAAFGFFEGVEHRVAGRHRYPTMPWRSERFPWRASSPAPLFGQHNAEVLGEILTMGPEQLADLAAAGVITSIPDPQGD